MQAYLFLKVLLQVLTYNVRVVLKRRLVELTTRHRQEVELESERAKQSQGQLEKTQMARERAHKQRVKGLEEQVSIRSYMQTLPIATEDFRPLEMFGPDKCRTFTENRRIRCEGLAS